MAVPVIPLDGNERPLPNVYWDPITHQLIIPQSGVTSIDTVAGVTYAAAAVVEYVSGNPISANNPLPIGHSSAGQINDPLGVGQSTVQTAFDGAPQIGVPAGSQQLVQPFTPAPTIAANIAIGSQVVTPSAMSGTSRGVPWSIQVGSYLIIANSNGSNLEKVRVTAVTASTFTATFVQTKTGPGITIVGEVLNQAKDSTIPDGSSPAGVPSSTAFLWNSLLNGGVGGLEIMRSAAGENSGATFGMNLAAEYEETSGGPPLANGTPSLLRYDPEIAALGKVASNAGAGFPITATSIGDALFTPTTPANFKTLTPGKWIRLSGGANAELVRVADSYVISIAPATIPLTSPVVNAGQNNAVWDTFGPNGAGQNPVLWSGEGLEGLILNDPSLPGFGRVWQGDVSGAARVTLQASSNAVTNSATAAVNAAATATLAAVPAKTNFLTGYSITTQGGTGAAAALATLVGTVSGTINRQVGAAANTPIQIDVEFPQPIPASAVNVALVLSVPALGANTGAVAVTLYGFVQ